MSAHRSPSPSSVDTMVIEDSEKAPSSPRMPSRNYMGSGTAEDPYVVDWDLNDPEDPYNWPSVQRWFITAQLALSTFTVSFSSSSYTGGIEYTMADLGISYNVAILGISLYVLGFALGYVGVDLPLASDNYYH
ncbi:hypothetical protein NLJ89_g12085 [Agrocybe chaxingu]|uniref:Uncharacterized protein n=1 Tax=Agrocybe chaxingu TaxID=84603 RepID=A0A9W8MQK0_9AGAR|nr:hypothetical protein NLJ89_g12085 [Agrocybe chaxingu]